ncbi:GNAT family N-acetyltransferase [Pseudomonas vanderleydeniana]|uniref:GNAT family N-acetyltransferase n=1 Tax=Pseudomonas vanderleydeniana TaxID=2745495 RepID=A0A9E6TPG5_9PSED|nr:GNAT family N-acetyltransferase [Pseudomonas vanderleydeniana]QXI25784.1 GNAT family N-acetyltransferase [Pseudomonas vanderleydeniana]
MEWHIRQAVIDDLEGLFRIDPIATVDSNRQAQIRKAVESVECWVACETGRPGIPIGYGCLDRSFFGQWFISLVMVASACQRSGVGRQIVVHLERVSGAGKIFTSTNLSNTPMQRLLLQLGYQSSGTVENLDPGDPELIFVKFLDQ